MAAQAPVPQVVQPKVLEKFPRSSLIAGKPCGQGGGFGNVISGTLDGKFVVVKILHAPMGKKRVPILQQMCQLEHRNLVRFMGIIDLEPTDCPQLVFKNANKGNLLEWLRADKGPSDQKTLQKFACDIINAMEYLHNMEFIHGCLAARNILLDEFCHTSGTTYLNAKISDYGMTRVIDGSGPNYYQMATAKTLPIRWMPKEAILTDGNSGEVTKPSDVWSFAVVLWEMWTKCDIPYGMTVSNTEVRQHILDGSSPLTFHRPAHCPEHVVAVMQNIFKINQAERPTFDDLRRSFDSIKGGKQSYKNNQSAGDNTAKGKNQKNHGKDGQHNAKKEQVPDKQPKHEFHKKKNTGDLSGGPDQQNWRPQSGPHQHQQKPGPNINQQKSGPNLSQSKSGSNQQKPGPNRHKSGPYQPETQSFGNIAPPPYSEQPSYPTQIPPMQPMGFNPQHGFPPTVAGMPPPYQQPGYYPQPMNMGMGPMGNPFPFGTSQMVPPPPYAVATAAETAAQTIRDLQNKINSLEVKQLEEKVQGLENQQRRQQKPGFNPHKVIKPQPGGSQQRSQQGSGQQHAKGRGQQGGQPHKPQNPGNRQGQEFEKIAEAAIAGMVAVTAAAAASKKSFDMGHRDKKK